jgi:excisionase family DNA binding protein
MPNEASPVRWSTVQEIARRLAVSVKTVRRRIASGELRAYRIGHLLRISEEDLRSFLEARPSRKTHGLDV